MTKDNVNKGYPKGSAAGGSNAYKSKEKPRRDANPTDKGLFKVDRKTSK